jgi:carboxyl-terminal PDZ ligand of neuronal nitric oxide synthase protein
LAFNLTNKQNSDKSPTTPLSTSREIQLLREQLDQQSIQTRQALAQLMMVREQLISETNARIEAQVRDHEIYNIIKIYI